MPKVIQINQWKGELTMVLYDNGQVFFERDAVPNISKTGTPWIEMKLPHEFGLVEENVHIAEKES